jgi:hypothetical protein
VGVILWSLSASAHDWLPRETLTRLCTSPVIDVLEWEWDLGSSAMEARILRPLLWFGLLESRTEPRSAAELAERRLYRKAPLFDRFLKFDVQVEGSDIRRTTSLRNAVTPMIESGRSPHMEPIVFFNSLDARKSRTGHHCPVLSSVNHVYSS